MSTAKTPTAKTPAANEAATPAAGEVATPAADAATPAATPAAAPAAEKPLTQADIDKAVKAAQKDWEKKAADAEAKLKLSDDERKDAEAKELRDQLRERDARDAVKDAAGELGAKNPAAVYRIIKDDLEFDDKGKVLNLTDALESAQSDFPELFTDSKPNESIDAGAGTFKPGQPLTRAAIDKMTPTEIAANMPAVDAFLASLK